MHTSRILTTLLALAALLAAASAETTKKSSSSKKEGGFTKPTPKPESAEIEKPFTTPIPSLRKKGSSEATPRPKKKSTTAPEPTEDKVETKAEEKPAETPASTPSPSASSSASKKKKTTGTTEPKETTTSEPSEKKEPEKTDSVKKETPAPKTYDNEGTGEPAAKTRAPAATIEASELVEYAAQPARVQTVISAALELTKLNLSYSYGSADPSKGGMDCSGTMYYLLRSQGFKDVPRDSSGQYVWARKQGQFFAVVSKSAESFEFKDLQPGDLMFWSGTYQVDREVPITHVMMYLGTEKKTKKRVMFGSSDGRSYNGVQRWGVSVFDFRMPKADPNNPEKTKVDFVGYARIPALRDGAVLAGPVEMPGAQGESATAEAEKSGITEEPAPTEKSTPTATPKKSTASSSKRKSSSNKTSSATPRPTKKKSSQ